MSKATPLERFRFKLTRRVVHYHGGYRWFVTDKTDAVFAHGQSIRRSVARMESAKKLQELAQ